MRLASRPSDSFKALSDSLHRAPLALNQKHQPLYLRVSSQTGTVKSRWEQQGGSTSVLAAVAPIQCNHNEQQRRIHERRAKIKRPPTALPSLKAGSATPGAAGLALGE